MVYSIYLAKNLLWEEGAGAKLLLYACEKRAGSWGDNWNRCFTCNPSLNPYLLFDSACLLC